MTLITAQNKYPNYPAFHEVVKRKWNTPRKEQLLISRIEAAQSPSIAPHLNQYEWNRVTLLSIHYLSAFRSLLVGNITAIQVATLFQFKNAHAQYNGEIEVINLFIQDDISERARNTIRSNSCKHLDEEEITAFFHLMKTKPVSEQRFFIIPNRAPPNDYQVDVITLSYALHGLDFNVFSNLPEKKWMVPSFGMMDAFSKVFGKERYIAINPVVGQSTKIEIILGMLNRIRDFAFELTHKAINFDGVDGYSIENPAHDFNHLHNQLTLPPHFLEAFGEISMSLLDDAEYSQEKVKSWLDEVIDELADQDHPELRKGNTSFNWLPNQCHLFWYLLGKNIDEVSKDLKAPFMTPHLRILINELKDKREAWIAKYQLDVLQIKETSIFVAQYEEKTYGTIHSRALYILADLIA